MVVFADFRKRNTNETLWGVTDGEKTFAIQPDYFMDTLVDYIENTKETFMAITNLSMVALKMLYDLVNVGYIIRVGNPKVKAMHEKQIKFMASDSFDFYSITIKRKKRGLVIADADKLITLSERKDIIDSWGDPFEESAENYASSVYKAVAGVTGDFEKKKPITISSAARRFWQRTHDDFSTLSTWVRDCNSLTINGMSAEEYLRPAYHGGYCGVSELANKNGEFKDCGSGIVLDYNGMYPYIMKTKPMPYCEPHSFEGKPNKEILDLSKRGLAYFFVKIRTSFELAPGGIPCVSVMGTEQSFMHEKGWLTTSKAYNRKTGEYIDNFIDENGNVKECEVELTLTQTDLALFLDNYIINKIEYINGCWFPTSKYLFRDYMDHWDKEKHEAGKNKNIGKRRIAKMFENSLSGNMARHTGITNLVIEYDYEKNEFIFSTMKLENCIKSYVHIGAAITSYGRKMLIDEIKRGNNQDYWLYSDTDSLHFKWGVNIEQFDIGEELGQFKVEKVFNHACYYKQKMYAMDYEDGSGIHLTFAGIPKSSVRYLEDLCSGRNPLDNKRSDFIEPTPTEEQEEIAEKIFCIDKAFHGAKGLEAMLREIGEEQDTNNIVMFKKLKDEINTYIQNGDILERLYYIEIPVWMRDTEDGLSEELKIVWRNVCDINQWAQV